MPRLLNLFQLNPASPAYGIADRQYAGWKTIDFSNATLQGSVYSICVASKLELLPQPVAIELFDLAFKAIPKVMNKNGSVNEAYPNENSFCVTALVVHDILSAFEYLPEQYALHIKAELLIILEPLVQFITGHGEAHAIISNHLATAYAALLLWNKHTGQRESRAQEILNIILEHQSDEGWFKEYEGADPGYQTLCLYYLVRAQDTLHHNGLASAIERSLTFLSHFVHPDGSIGGLYGSRNTKVLYPGGLANLAKSSDIANAMMRKLESGLNTGVHILPSDIDIGNFAPLLNSYAYAAVAGSANLTSAAIDLPMAQIIKKKYLKAGIYIESNERYYAISNLKKGGTLMVFDKSTQTLVAESGGVWGKLRSGKTFSTQAFQDEDWAGDLVSHSTFSLVNDEQPTPFKFLVLRILTLTIFRSVFLGDVFKKMVVGRLMTGKRSVGGSCTRSITFNEEEVIVRDVIQRPANCIEFKSNAAFKAIHMASSGYNNAHAFLLNKKTDWIKFEMHES